PALQSPHERVQPESADMDDDHRKDLAELAELIDRHSSGTGGNETAIPGVSCYREIEPNRTTPTVYVPSLCVIAQGRKQAMLGREVYRYGPSEYLIVSVDLPITGTVTEASDARPYLCLKIDIDLQQLSELVLDTQRAISESARGLFVGTLRSEEHTSELQSR